MNSSSQFKPAGAYLNRIGTACPANDIHDAFVDWSAQQLKDRRERAVFERMASRSAISHRWSVLGPDRREGNAALSWYGSDAGVATRDRMEVYGREAPVLAMSAIEQLGDIGAITHLVTASCTGFVAPGIDQIIAQALGLPNTVERTFIGFMGCYAAIPALRTARQIVRSEPHARVLVVTVELCTLHLQPDADVEKLLAMMLFGDGAGAAIVSAEPEGLELTEPFALALPDSAELMTWRIGDYGFSMHLSGQVPIRIASALSEPSVRETVEGAQGVDSWAVHAGGRSILDAVTRGLLLEDTALDHSRAILESYGNMSSATILYVLERIIAQGRHIEHGRALAFGPGLTAEGFGYRSAP